MELSEPEKKTYKALMALYGIDAQTEKLEEELVELLHSVKVFKKDPNPENEEYLVKELVDAYLMIMQIASFYGWDEFTKYRDKKINVDLPEKIVRATEKNSNCKFLIEEFFPEYLESKSKMVFADEKSTGLYTE